MKVTYYAAMSSDGFIARDKGDVSWLDDLDIDYSGIGYEGFFASVDGLVVGRGTYDFIFDYGSWPYDEKLTWVCTNRALEALPGANPNIATLPY
ncbi:MAG: dihydrofolate reductase [Pseudohongiellaceae bacterium]|jgi:dihydrofolate reductase